MARGGSRAGVQGRAYANRTDLNAQPVRVAPSKTYGDAAASQRAQEAVPLPQAQVLGLNAPSTRPGEHVMTGVPRGPGAGPEILPTPQRNFAMAPAAALSARDRLQVLLKAGLDAGENVDDLALLVNQLSRA